MWWFLLFCVFRVVVFLRDRRRTALRTTVLRKGNDKVTIVFPGLYMSPKRLLHLADPSHPVVGVGLVPGNDFDPLVVTLTISQQYGAVDTVIGYSMGGVMASLYPLAQKRVLYAPAGRKTGTLCETAVRCVARVSRIVLGTPYVLTMYPTYGHSLEKKNGTEVVCGGDDYVHPPWNDADRVYLGVGTTA